MKEMVKTMKKAISWKSIVRIIGNICLIIGAVDPLEGSVVIVAGIVLLAWISFLLNDRFWKLYLICSILIFAGVFFMFVLSGLGGFGGDTVFSWWWGILIIPYPAGWILALIFLIRSALINNSNRQDQLPPAGNVA